MLAREEKLTEIARRLQEAAGENLQSIVLYGSGARGDYHAHKSDLNLLCILKSAKATDLSRIASTIRWWSGQLNEPPPRIFTREELIHSADRSEEHTSELQSHSDLVCRLLLEKKNKKNKL